jgi:hypothetical protein
MKNFDKTGFWMWTDFFFAALLILLLICGCKPKGPSRFASGIAYGDNGRDTGWFQYVMETGEPIEQEGIAMNCIFSKTCWFGNDGNGGIKAFPVRDGIQELQSSRITGPGGQMTVKGCRRDWNDFFGVWLYNQASICDPLGRIGRSARFTYCTVPVEQKALSDCGTQLIGEYVASNRAKYTQKETEALQGITVNPPISGVMVTDCSLLQQQSNAIKDLDYPVASNLQNNSDYLRYSAPMMFSVIFKTAQGVDVAGKSVSVIIKTDAKPEGTKLDLNILGSSPDKMTHLARTEYFIPVDSLITTGETVQVYDRWTPFENPNIWDTNQYDRKLKPEWASIIDPNDYADPNLCTDPNVFDFTSRLDTTADNFEQIMIPERVCTAKTIPLAAIGDNLDIDLNILDPELILLFSVSWLTNNRIYDTNNDGIVNMRDIP